MRLFSFGEIIWDVYKTSAHLGGAPLNLAGHCAVQGNCSYIISAVGSDELGRRAIDEIEKLGVNTKYISLVPHKETGQCIVELDENKIPAYKLKDNTAYDFIKMPCFEQNHETDVICFGTLALRHKNNLDVLENILKAYCFKEIFTDLNIRPPYYSKENIDFCLKYATIAKISDEELPLVTKTLWGEFSGTDKAVEKLSRCYNNLKLIIITMGEKGSVVYNTKTGEAVNAEPVKVEVSSTVGAGDSFSATFLSEYFKGNTLKECLFVASKVSAYVVSQYDAIPKYDINTL